VLVGDGYLCGVPECAGDWYQPRDHLLHLAGETTLVVEVTGGGRCEDVVEQLIVGRDAVDRRKVSLKTSRHVVPAARRTSHCRDQLDEQPFSRRIRNRK